MDSNAGKDRVGRANRRIVLACALTFCAMVGLTFASVPLYRLFCQVTGFGGTTQRAEQPSDRILDRVVTIRFDANVAGGLPWEFKPVQRELKVRLGEVAEARYMARNLTGTPVRGRATFNVTPLSAGAYFNKMECFCFTDTELQPGESMDMPVVFFVDPDLEELEQLSKVATITLSYTFFPIDSDGPQARAATEANLDERAGG
jgi:cytochrome c oxidase assembly protein subunit 11